MAILLLNTKDRAMDLFIHGLVVFLLLCFIVHLFTILCDFFFFFLRKDRDIKEIIVLVSVFMASDQNKNEIFE